MERSCVVARGKDINNIGMLYCCMARSDMQQKDKLTA
jgi:hypothetical protein